jgi:hypothetical protein
MADSRREQLFTTAGGDSAIASRESSTYDNAMASTTSRCNIFGRSCCCPNRACPACNTTSTSLTSCSKHNAPPTCLFPKHSIFMKKTQSILLLFPLCTLLQTSTVQNPTLQKAQVIVHCTNSLWLFVCCCMWTQELFWEKEKRRV